VVRVTDEKGNFFTVRYIEDAAGGGYRVDRIDYAGRSVRFEYEYGIRPDPVTVFVAGSIVRTTHRLTKLRTFVGEVGEAPVREYSVRYDAPGILGGSRVSSIQECAGAECM